MPSSFRRAPSAFHLQCGSEAGRANRIIGRRAHGATSRFASVSEAAVATFILTLLGVLTNAAL
jgi:hypothetical protein